MNVSPVKKEAEENTNTVKSVMANLPGSTSKLDKLVSEKPQFKNQVQVTMDQVLSKLYSQGQQKEQEITRSKRI